MARIVLGIGTSHSPILTLPGEQWQHRAAADLANPRLSLSDGRFLNYQQLVEERGEPYSKVATHENFTRIASRCQSHLDRLADAIAQMQPDVMVIVGDDQSELYSPGNMPAVAVFWGETVLTHRFDGELPDWMRTVAEGYGMDQTHRFAGAPEFARQLIEGLVSEHVDVAICKDVPDPERAGFGHAFGYPVERLFRNKVIPIVPLMLNTYYPPNVLPASRCFDIGRALRRAVENVREDLRVAVLGSGGLSHFVVDEELDLRILNHLEGDSAQVLREVPRCALNEGSSEILNWILTAGAVSHLPLVWKAYEPVQRTPAGTGIGLGFAVWSEMSQ
jgi:hypothetical protein